jgi:hypothetical protein
MQPTKSARIRRYILEPLLTGIYKMEKESSCKKVGSSTVKVFIIEEVDKGGDSVPWTRNNFK